MEFGFYQLVLLKLLALKQIQLSLLSFNSDS